jgi:hypothetical protein
MKLVNRYGAPDAFFRAVQNDPYEKHGDFSATGLLQPPRATVLLELHKDTIEVDVTTKIAACIGQGVHSLLERAARPGIDIVEKRYFASFDVDGKSYVVSAQIDLYEGDTKTLSDWKTTKAYAFSKKAGNGRKPEWIQQMNIQRLLCEQNGVEVRTMQIIGLLKDWNKREAQAGSHPATEIMTVEIPVWSREATQEFIVDRIRAHVNARHSLPQCSSKEAWGGSRCGQWCDANSVCSQYQNSLKTGLFKLAEGV